MVARMGFQWRSPRWVHWAAKLPKFIKRLRKWSKTDFLRQNQRFKTQTQFEADHSDVRFFHCGCILRHKLFIGVSYSNFNFSWHSDCSKFSCNTNHQRWYCCQRFSTAFREETRQTKHLFGFECSSCAGRHWIKWVLYQKVFSLGFQFSTYILGIYIFILIEPSGWTSFKRPNGPPLNLDVAREMVGNYGYLALLFILLMQFCSRIGVGGIPYVYMGECFPFQ